MLTGRWAAVTAVTTALGLIGCANQKSDGTKSEGSRHAPTSVSGKPPSNQANRESVDTYQTPQSDPAARGGWRLHWSEHKQEILTRFRSLIRIDSRAGKEVKVVDYLRQVLESEGIPTQTFAKDPNRPNLVARLKGNGSKRPLLILAHTDTVGVQPEKWPMDPFGAEIKEGYIWGRGSVDDKPVLTANLMVMLLLKRNKVPLDRDVIFLAESSEEGSDPDKVGINLMVDHHYDAIDAEFALTEDDKGPTYEDGKVVRMEIGTAEKFPARAWLVATGTSGHGSVPRLDNALIYLAGAVHDVGLWEPPMRLNQTTRTYFEKLAANSPPQLARVYRGLLDPDPRTVADAQRYLREKEPNTYALLRTTVVPTILKAGEGVNVVPSKAEAGIDIRALPDEDIQKFYAEMTRVINNPAVEIVPMAGTRPPSPTSRTDNEMFRVMERVSAEMYPGAIVIPTMSRGSSDKAQLRVKGQQTYGLGAPSTLENRIQHGSHSDVERIAEPAIYTFVEFFWNIVTDMAASK